jgi:hypothetical protein
MEHDEHRPLPGSTHACILLDNFGGETRSGRQMVVVLLGTEHVLATGTRVPSTGLPVAPTGDSWHSPG